MCQFWPYSLQENMELTLFLVIRVRKWFFVALLCRLISFVRESEQRQYVFHIQHQRFYNLLHNHFSVVFWCFKLSVFFKSPWKTNKNSFQWIFICSCLSHTVNFIAHIGFDTVRFLLVGFMYMIFHKNLKKEYSCLILTPKIFMYYLLSVASILFEISCKMRGFFLFVCSQNGPFLLQYFDKRFGWTVSMDVKWHSFGNSFFKSVV